MESPALAALKEAVVAIGYYIPNQRPEFLGTGFLIGEGDRAFTCAHVVLEESDDEDRIIPIPREKQFGEKLGRLTCWAFVTKDSRRLVVNLPILNIAVYTDVIFSDYFERKSPDVAYLVLDLTIWHEYVGSRKPNVLTVSNKILRDIGSNVAIIGYPSINILMTSDDKGKPKCLEPLTQFARLAGVLPFSEVPLATYLAFDCVFSKGSSGSPIINIADEKVIAMASNIHPFFLPSYLKIGDVEGQLISTVPSGIGLGVPSNFFAGLSLSRTGEAKFDFNP